MHSLKEYLKRQSSKVLQMVLLNHWEDNETIGEEAVRIIEEILRQRANDEENYLDSKQHWHWRNLIMKLWTRWAEISLKLSKMGKDDAPSHGYPIWKCVIWRPLSHAEAAFLSGLLYNKHTVLHWKSGLFGGISGGTEKSPGNLTCRIPGFYNKCWGQAMSLAPKS